MVTATYLSLGCGWAAAVARIVRATKACQKAKPLRTSPPNGDVTPTNRRTVYPLNPVSSLSFYKIEKEIWGPNAKLIQL